MNYLAIVVTAGPNGPFTTREEISDYVHKLGIDTAVDGAKTAYEVREFKMGNLSDEILPSV